MPPPGAGTDQAPVPRERRRWPWVVGIVVALMVGVGIGASGDDPPPAEPANNAATNSRELADLQASLDDTQEQLATVATERDTALEDLRTAEAARDDTSEDLETAQANLAAAEDDRDAAIARAEDAEAALADVEAAKSAKPHFDDGTWVVGEDIQPGVYRNTGDGSWCYWERLSGLSGEFGDIIANGNPDGPAVVEISSSDAAFSAQGCGTWTQQ